MLWCKFIVVAMLTLGSLWLCNTKFYDLPPIGKFLSPFHGCWQNATHTDANLALSLPNLTHSIIIQWDKRRVPHIFSQDDQAAYFAQGYVTAHDRLWQMEFLARAAAGRLSEVVGPKALNYDKTQRGLGMTYAAERSLVAIEKNPISKQMLDAYTQGVNAYVASLTPSQYPIEYKILDYTPEPWTNFKTALLSKYMAWMLTGSTEDLYLSRLLRKYDFTTLLELFPIHTNETATVIPHGTTWDFSAPVLTKPEEIYVPKFPGGEEPGLVPFGNGSNNWAVSGQKTASGYPILANDPHLDLNLPSIWYEVQLVTPTQNVYGVSVPGAPGILVGFNSKISWGVTNSYMDVLDWYELEFKDDTWAEYRYGEGWRATAQRQEVIHIRDQAPLIYTVFYTHYGPVTVNPHSDRRTKFPVQAAMRWTGHEPSNEVLAYYLINHAQNYAEFVEGLRLFESPGQNFVFASQQGDIAIWHNGKFPIKWPGQGMTISNGSDPKYEWQGWIPHEQNPHILNPSQGFVFSANQMATDSSYPYFMTGPFEFYRPKRIQEVLANLQQITPKDMQQLQTDNKSVLAASILPQLLNWLEPGQFKANELAIFECLKKWNFNHDADALAPTVFVEWWKRLEKAIWEDELGKDHAYYMYPFWYRTAHFLINDPQSRWIDDIRTEAQETSADLAKITFTATCQALTQKYGEFGPAWNWGKHKGTQIQHLLEIPGFGHSLVICNGGRHIVNASGKSLGSSWRMIVSLEPQIKAWGIYPGGQSGHPGSPHYEEFLETWRKGELHPLLYCQTTNDAIEQSQLSHIWQMQGRQN